MKNEANTIQAAGRLARRGLGFLLAMLMLVSVLAVPGFAGIRADTEILVGAGSDTKFYAPETVYLKPRGSESQYFADSTTSGAPTTIRDKAWGLLYFSAAGSKITKVEYAFIEAKERNASGNFVPFATDVAGVTFNGAISGYGSINGGGGASTGVGDPVTIFAGAGDSEMSVTINSIRLNSSTSKILPPHGYALVRWTVTYKLNEGTPEETTNQAYAYTVLYAPALEESGMFGRYTSPAMIGGGIGNDDWAVSYAFVAGIHGTAGGNRTRLGTYPAPGSNPTTGTYSYPAIEKYDSAYMSGINSNVTSNAGMKETFFPACNTEIGGIWQWDHGERGDTHAYTGKPAAHGLITVDTSRYDNLNQIPNLSAGFTLFRYRVDNTNKDNRLQTITIVDGTALNPSPVILPNPRPFNFTAPNDTEGIYTHGLYPINTGTWAIKDNAQLVIETAYEIHSVLFLSIDTWDTYIKQRARLDITTVDKGPLRSAVRNSIAAPLDMDPGNTDLIFDVNTYLLPELDNAAWALGYPEATQTAISSAVDSLQGAVTKVRSHMATEKLVLMMEGLAKAPESLYLKPGGNSIYYVMTDSNLYGSSPQLTNKLGNPGDAKIDFRLPSMAGVTPRSISFYTLDKNGNPANGIVSAVTINPGESGANAYRTANLALPGAPVWDPVRGENIPKPAAPVEFFDGSGLADQARFSITASGTEGVEGAIVWLLSYEYIGITYETEVVTWIHKNPDTLAGIAPILNLSTSAGTGQASLRGHYYVFMTGIHSASGGNSTSAFTASSGQGANPLKVCADLTENPSGGTNSGSYGRDCDDSGTGGAVNGKYGGPNNVGYVPTGGAAEIWQNNNYWNSTVGGVWRSRGTTVANATWTVGPDSGSTISTSRYTNLYSTMGSGIPTAELVVDTSRTNAYNQIPFFSIGAMMLGWNSSEGRDYRVNKIDSFREIALSDASWGNSGSQQIPSKAIPAGGLAFIAPSATTYLSLKDSNSGNNNQGRSVAGLKTPYQGTISGASSRLMAIEFIARANDFGFLGANKPDQVGATMYMYVNTGVVNKGTLRTKYFKETNVFRAKDYYVESYYYDYVKKVVEAGVELGRVICPNNNATAWQTKIAKAVEWLTSYDHDTNPGYDGDGNAITDPVEFANIDGNEDWEDILAAWVNLYKHDAEKPNTDHRNTGSAFKSRSYAEHRKVAKSVPGDPSQFEAGDLFYRDNVGTFFSFDDPIFLGSSKYATPQELYESIFPDGEPYDADMRYTPGPNNAPGDLYLPGEYYIETLPSGGEVLHPLITPEYTYNSTVYHTMPLAAAPDTSGPLYDGWKAQWTAFKTAYPEYPDGSYVIWENSKGEYKILPLEVPNEEAEHNPYPNGSTVVAWPESPRGFVFNPDGRDDVRRWGVDKNQANSAVLGGNMILAGNGLGNDFLNPGSKEDFGGAAHPVFSIDPAGSSNAKDGNPLKTYDAALQYTLTFGRIRYDLFYYPKTFQYKYTSIGVIEPGEPNNQSPSIPIAPDDYTPEISVDYYSKVTVGIPGGYPPADIPKDKRFVGWQFSGDNRIYQDGQTFVWLSESSTEEEVFTFTPVFGDLLVNLIIDGNGGTFSILNPPKSNADYYRFVLPKTPGEPYDGVSNPLDTNLLGGYNYKTWLTNGGKIQDVSYLRTEDRIITEDPTPFVSGLVAKRRGYDFAGWKPGEGEDPEITPAGAAWAPGVKKAYNGKVGGIGEDVEVTFGSVNSKITAQWQPKEYTVRYWQNGFATLPPSPASVSTLEVVPPPGTPVSPGGNTQLGADTAKYGESYTLWEANKFTASPPPGYAFAGWYVVLFRNIEDILDEKGNLTTWNDPNWIPTEKEYRERYQKFYSAEGDLTLTDEWLFDYPGPAIDYVEVFPVFKELQLDVYYYSNSDNAFQIGVTNFEDPSQLPYNASQLTLAATALKFNEDYNTVATIPENDEKMAFDGYVARLEKYNTTTKEWEYVRQYGGLGIGQSPYGPGTKLFPSGGGIPGNMLGIEATPYFDGTYRVVLIATFSEVMNYTVAIDPNLDKLSALSGISVGDFYIGPGAAPGTQTKIDGVDLPVGPVERFETTLAANFGYNTVSYVDTPHYYAGMNLYRSLAGPPAFSANLPTPTVAGTYRGKWKLAHGVDGADMGLPSSTTIWPASLSSLLYKPSKAHFAATPKEDFIILYIEWANPKFFYVKYNPNGGSFEAPDGSGTFDTEGWLDLDHESSMGSGVLTTVLSPADDFDPQPTRAGYEPCTSWDLLDPDGVILIPDVKSGENISAYVDELMKSDDLSDEFYIELHAHWEAKKKGIDIYVDLNGGVVTGNGLENLPATPFLRKATVGKNYGTFASYTTPPHAYGDKVDEGVLPIGTPVKEGYEFLGWMLVGDSKNGPLWPDTSTKREFINEGMPIELPTSTSPYIQVQAQYKAIDPDPGKPPTSETSAQLVYHLNGLYASFDTAPTYTTNTISGPLAVANGAKYLADIAPKVYRLPVKAEMELTADQLVTPVRPGYVFDGWYSTPDTGGIKYTVAGKHPVLLEGDNVVENTFHIYARWRVSTSTDPAVTVIFEFNGGALTPVTDPPYKSVPDWTDALGGTKYEDHSFTGTPAYDGLPNVIRPGYDSINGLDDVDAWHTQPQNDPTGDRLITNYDKIEPEDSTLTITLYKWWQAIPGGVTVYFDINAGSLVPTPDYLNDYTGTAGTTTYGTLIGSDLQPITPQLITPTFRTGWSFVGWKVMKSEATYGDFKVGGVVDNDKLTVAPSIGTGVIDPLADGDPYNEYKIYLCAFWNANVPIVINRNTMGGVEMLSIGGAYATDTINSATPVANNIDLEVPVRAGYVFLGWGSSAIGDVADVTTYNATTSVHTGTKNVDYLLQLQNSTTLTVYAKWAKDETHKIKLVFDAVGGDRPANGTLDFADLTDGDNADEAYVLVIAGTVLDGARPDTARIGYDWDTKWYNEDGDEINWSLGIEADDPASTDLNPERRVYAVWTDKATPGETSVYWHANLGYFPASENPSAGNNALVIWSNLTAGEKFEESGYSYASGFFYPTPQRSGYTGLGWFNNVAGTGSELEDTDLIAPNRYDPVTGTPRVAVQDVWYQWTPERDSVKVKFNLNGGVTSNAAYGDIAPVTPDVSYNLLPGYGLWSTATDLVRAGYTFGGWYQDVAGTVPIAESAFTGSAIAGADPVRPAVDAVKVGAYYEVTLVAKWVKDTETGDDRKVVVLWDPNGGNPEIPPYGEDLNFSYYNAGDPFAYVPEAVLTYVADKYCKPGYKLTAWESEDLLPVAWASGYAPASIPALFVEPQPGLGLSTAAEYDGNFDGKYVVVIRAVWTPIDPGDSTDGDKSVFLTFSPNGGTAILKEEQPEQGMRVKADEEYGTYVDLGRVLNADGSYVSVRPFTERGGYNFLGWSIQGTSAILTNDTLIKPSLTSNEIVLVAHWGNEDDEETLEDIGITNGTDIIYVVNNGSAMAVNPRKATAGKPYTDADAPLSGTTRPGYKLEGWYLDAACTAKKVITKEYADAHSLVPTIIACDPLTGKSVKLYANWIADDSVTINLSFNSKGGTPITVAQRVVQAGKQYVDYYPTDWPAAPIRAGYEFIGWYPLPAPTTPYDEPTVTTGVVTATSIIEPQDFKPDGFEQSVDGKVIDLTLFAHWKSVENAVKVVFRGEPYYDNDIAHIITPYTEKMVTAGGKYGDGAGWKNGAVSLVAPQPRLPDAPLNGYNFIGWFLEPIETADHDALYMQAGAIQVFEDTPLVDLGYLNDPTKNTIILYAHYVAEDKETKITLHADSVPSPTSTASIPNPGTGLGAKTVEIKNTLEHPYYETNAAYAEPSLADFVTGGLYPPTRTGYTFTGWFDGPFTETNTPKRVLTEAEWLAEDPGVYYLTFKTSKDLYAGWTPVTGTVTFQGPTGMTGLTIEPASKPVTFDAAYGTLPVPTKDGYKFKEWRTASGELVTKDTLVSIVGSHTLFAVMEATDFDLILNPMGGTVTPNKITLAVIDKYPELPTPVKPGYNFVGWWYSPEGADGAGDWIDAGDDLFEITQHTAYAIWSAKNDLIVIFDPCGGVVAPAFKVVTFAAPYGDLPIPVNAGFKFLGWYTDDVGGTLVESTTDVAIPVSHVLYARWERVIPPIIPVVLPVVVPVPIVLPLPLPGGSTGGGGCPCCGEDDCCCGDGCCCGIEPEPGTTNPGGNNGPGNSGGGNVFPDTGATSGLGIFGALALSGAAVLLLGKKRRKDEDEEDAA